MEKSDRIDREREFHDDAFAHNARGGIGKFYSIAGKAFDLYSASIGGIVPGEVVLEYGCGTGSYAFSLSQKGAGVTGIDISEEAIAQAKARSAHLNLTAEFRVMNAESLDFPSGHFDMVCGSGILHHLDLEKAYSEIARVISPNGKAVFLEPLGHNPLVKVFRSRTRELRTKDEHPLLMSDIALARKYFSSVRYKTFCFTSLLAIPFIGRRGFRHLLAKLTAVDELLERICPPLRRYYWIAVMEVSEPIR